MNDKLQDFIERAKQVHNNMYDYSLVEYTNNHTHVEIICLTHGNFMMRPKNHLNGNGCKYCVNENKSKQFSKGLSNFIDSARKVHGDKYDYSRVIYTNQYNKVEIGHPDGYWFWQIPKNHLHGHNPKSDTMKSRSTNLERYGTEWSASSKEVQQKISNTNMKRYGVKTTLLEQTTIEKIKSTILKKYGVPNVAQSHISPDNLHKLQDFDFMKAAILDVSTHKLAEQLGVSHPTICKYLQKHAIYDGFKSHLERAFASWLNSLNIDFVTDRIVLGGLEIDRYSPVYKIGFEIHGLYSHAQISAGKSPKYHYEKLRRARNAGIRLIQIFEDEWNDRKAIVQTIIKTQLGIGVRGLGSRSLDIKRIEKSIATDFLNLYHLQGGQTTINFCVGAFYEKQLLAVMVFGPPTRQSNYHYELKRYCTDGLIYPGVGSRMFNFFIKEQTPSSVVSFCDNRWFTGESYIKMGFLYDGETEPNYTYTNNYATRQHKAKFKLNRLAKLYNIEGKTAWMIMQELGYDRIWDCGKKRFVWRC